VNRNHLVPRAVVAAVLFLAIGCGGVTTEITVSEHNAETLATAGLDAVRMIEDVSGMIDRFSESFFDPAQRLVLCDTGDVAISVNDVGAEGLSTGDDANVDFNACVVALDDGPLTLDGSLYLRAEDITGDPSGAFTREVYASFDAATVVFLDATVVIDGGITASLSSPDGVTFVADISGDSFSALAQEGDRVFSGSLSDFHGEGRLDTSADTYSVEFEATVYTDDLGGSAHFETTVPFTGAVDEYPSAGTFVATGANGATVTLVAIDNVNVQILIDEDGDGTPSTIDTTWEVLGNIP